MSEPEAGSQAAPGSDWRALVTITTCNRFRYLRRYLPHFARFCAGDRRFRLLVAIDGQDRESLEFCDAWEIPVVYSAEREGVGLSKNRVLERQPGFDYYFFLDDDVELVDGRVFPEHVELSCATGIHHFSLFERGGVRHRIGESFAGGHRIVHGLYGGGVFNFYTGEGLRLVGGWHPRFAEYRRFGHTEHSYRFFRAGLAPAPFNVAEDLSETCIWHWPPTVTPDARLALDEDQLTVPERELIDLELTNVPLETLSPIHTNEVALDSPPSQLAATLSAGERYPLTDGAERRQCRSDYRLWEFRTSRSGLRRAAALAAAVADWPGNPALRHMAKTALKR